MRGRVSVTVPSLVLALVVAAAAPAQAADPRPAPGVLTDLGEPIRQVLSHDQALGFGPSGEPQAYFVVGGNANMPAEFAVVDLRTRTTTVDVRLPCGEVSWAVDYSAHEKAAYAGISAGGCPGHLYRHRAGTQDVESLGVPLPGEGIWTLDVAPDGIVYAGTYPGGRLFSYDPASGAVRDFGQAVPGETYLRSVEATADTVWFGTQPGAELAALDRASGTITRIPLPEPYASWTGAVVYDLAERGDRLFVRVTGTNVTALLVYDVPSGTWVDAMPSAGNRAVSPIDPADGRTVYFRSGTGATIVAYDIQTLTARDTGFAPNAYPGDFAWVDLQDPAMPGLSLALSYYYGRIYAWHPATGRTYYHQAVVQGAANPLTAITAGPDGKVYVGAYLSPPGMSRLDPATGAFQLLGGSGQVEGFGAWNGRLVYGRYPGGNLLAYDPARPWAAGTNPGPPTPIGEAQDRPKGFAQLGDRVVVASVPTTGELGGALSLWDPATGSVEAYRDVVPAQSPVSVVVHGGLVYAGTSIWGGWGVDPTATEGRLVVWDPATRRVVHQTVPVPGSDGVAALAIGPNGHLYGLADGTLFSYDPASRAVLRTQRVAEGSSWRHGDDQVIRFVDGRLFATTGGAVFHVDQVTWAVTPLVTGVAVTGLTVDPAGDLYFMGRSTHVYRYDLSDDVTAPAVRATVLPPRPVHAAVVLLSARDAGIGVRAVQYRVDGGSWQRYERPFLVFGPGRHTVEYRAVDHAFNASPVRELTVHIRAR